MAKIKRSLKSLIALTLITTNILFGSSTSKIAKAATTDTFSNTVTQTYVSSSNNLTEKTQDGAILHAWNWSFNTIKANLQAIADAGYSSVQVSPIQGTKENLMDTSKWWLLYQPTNFSIGNAQLGSRDEFKAMCDEAEKYGIKIIVDVVANHTANRGGGTDQYWPATNVDAGLLNDAGAWHEHRGVDNWNDRWQVTHLGIGLPDLNTSSYNVQNKIISYLNDRVSAGADGFRFDAAKHIELPDDSGGSDFWSRVLGSVQNRNNLFIYGEVLQGGADRYASYSQYMNLAADHYGNTIRNAVGFSGTKGVSGINNYSSDGVNADHLITWVESHDTYANDSSESTAMNPWQIKMGWAMIASRAYSTPLYFNRPQGTAKLQGSMGNVGNDNWKDPDVVAVNKFRNAMVGEGEYLRQQSNDVMMIERGTKGAVIVNLGGNTYLNSDTKLANGTYTNKATAGGTFTVSNGKITGDLSTGITVLYNDKLVTIPEVYISKANGEFVSSLQLTLGVKNATESTYSINNGQKQSYTNGQVITIGENANIGDKVTVTLDATDGKTPVSTTYTYTKVDKVASSKVYFNNINNWTNPTIYVYNDSVSPTKVAAAWPGIAMTKEANGLYSYTLPENFGNAKVIFSNNGGSQIPAASQPGLTITAGTSMVYNNGTWQEYKEVILTPSVSSSPADSSFVGSLQLTLGSENATSSTYSINNGTALPYTNGQTITIGQNAAIGDNITVILTAINGSNTTSKTYTYTKIEEPVKQLSKVYFYNTKNWSTPTIYVYNDSVSPVKIMSAWPGVPMTKEGDGSYSYTLPEGFGDAKVIFSDNGNNQTPAQGQAGYIIKSGATMEYNNGTWKVH
nr:starch-binding protein [Clostridium chromiireducens]